LILSNNLCEFVVLLKKHSTLCITKCITFCITNVYCLKYDKLILKNKI